jgi:uncharacterized protein
MKSRCPVCRKVMDKAGRQSSREGGYYPFCCNRCRMLDLGKWFDGDYRIPVEVRPEEAEDISGIFSRLGTSDFCRPEILAWIVSIS